MYEGTVVTGLETLKTNSDDFKRCLERANQSQLRRAIAAVEADEGNNQRDARLKKLKTRLDDAPAVDDEVTTPADNS